MFDFTATPSRPAKSPGDVAVTSPRPTETRVANRSPTSLHASATRVSVDLAGREGVAVKSNMFDFFLRLFGDFVKSPVGPEDVAATKYVFEEEDVSATSPRPTRDQMIEEKLPRAQIKTSRKNWYI